MKEIVLKNKKNGMLMMLLIIAAGILSIAGIIIGAIYEYIALIIASIIVMTVI